MKKLTALTLALTAVVVPAMAEESRPVRVVGELAKSNMTEEELDLIVLPYRQKANG